MVQQPTNYQEDVNNMKKIALIILILGSYRSYAQHAVNMNAIYYLIDTTHTLINDRMWDIHEEAPSIKTYTIKCPCLQYNNEPTFIYNIGQTETRTITRTDVRSVKLIPLYDLILKAKEATNVNFKGHYEFYLIEPYGKGYIIHKVRLLPALKPQTSY